MDPSPQNLRLLLDGEVKIGRALKAGALFVWRILRALFAKGISLIIRLGNRRPPVTIPRPFVAREFEKAGQRLEIRVSRVPPWAMFALALLLAFVCGWFAGRSDGVKLERARWVAAQAKAIERGAEAQRGLDANVQRREAEHEETRAATQIIVHRTREEITHAEDLDALDAAHSRAVAELRERAEASAARAASNYLASFAS